MHVTFKTLLNRLQPLNGFIYESERLVTEEGRLKVVVDVRPHGQRKARCSICRCEGPGYDHLPERSWEFVPVYNVAVEWRYKPRRVECLEHGVVVEYMPWSEGKREMTVSMMQFLANWARRLSWKETARIFKVKWQSVRRAVEWIVDWGLKHRDLTGIKAIGVDEIQYRKGMKSGNFVTLIYQIDAHCRRLLWVGQKRKTATLKAGLRSLGEVVLSGILYVCSDMWKGYLKAIRQVLPAAVHMIDRFHVVQRMNQALDDVRRKESASKAKPAAAKLKKMRWALLKRGNRVLGKARIKLHALLASRTKTARAYILKEAFQHFWTYSSPTWARGFLSQWITRAKRSRIKQMIKVAETLQSHQELIINWITARREIRSGAVEGFNNKARVLTKRSYGFRTFDVLQLALFHTLGKLPEPVATHEFW